MKTSITFILIAGLMSIQHAQAACIQRNGVWLNSVTASPCTPSQEETELTNNVQAAASATATPASTTTEANTTTETGDSGATTENVSEQNGGKKQKRNASAVNYKMDEVNKTGTYGGQYGGKNVETTRLINQSLEMGNQMADKIGTAAVAGSGSTQTAEVAQKGLNATSKDYVNAQKKVLDANHDANITVGTLNTAAAATQGLFSILHASSAKNVKKSMDAELDKIDGELTANKSDSDRIKDKEIPEMDKKITACQANIDCKTGKTTQEEIAACDASSGPCCDASELAQYKTQRTQMDADLKTLAEERKAILARQDNVQLNGTKEAQAQKDQALVNGVAAAQTAAQASLHYMNAAKSKALAESLTDNSTGGTTGSFNYTPPTGTIDEGGLAPTAAESAAVVNTDPANDGQGLDGGIKDFNPGFNQGGAAGPAPMAFKDDAGKGGGGGSGGGLGGAGGTSASRDSDGKQPEAGPGKSQTGGQYAAGEGSSPRFGRSSGGSGVGFDTSFGDLLKKFLPGGKDEKKEQASLDMNSDRSPASDQAAVIGRNKNIFIEISKRYQKKNSEGAVIFQ